MDQDEAKESDFRNSADPHIKPHGTLESAQIQNFFRTCLAWSDEIDRRRAAAIEAERREGEEK